MHFKSNQLLTYFETLVHSIRLPISTSICRKVWTFVESRSVSKSTSWQSTKSREWSFLEECSFSTNSSPTVKHAIRVTQESFGATNLEKDLGQRNFIQDKKWLKKIRYKLKEWMNWEIDRSWCKNFYLKLLKSLKKTRALWLLNGAPPPCKLQHWL